MSVVVPYTANDLAITDAFERELMMDNARDMFEIERDVMTSDGAGGQTVTTSVIASGFCQFRQVGANASEAAVASALSWSLAMVIDLPDDVDVTPADRIIIEGVRVFEIGGIIDLGQGSTQKTLIVREYEPQ